MKCPSWAGKALVLNDRQGVALDDWLFFDSDHEHGRSPQGNRKKPWLNNIFD